MDTQKNISASASKVGGLQDSLGDNSEELQLLDVIKEVITVLSEMNQGLSQDYHKLSRELRYFKLQAVNFYLPSSDLGELTKRRENCMRSISDVVTNLQFYDRAAQKIDHQIAILALLQDESRALEMGNETVVGHNLISVKAEIAELACTQLIQIQQEYQEALDDIEGALPTFLQEISPWGFDFTSYARHLQWYDQLSKKAISSLQLIAARSEASTPLSDYSKLAHLFSFYTVESEREVHAQLFPMAEGEDGNEVRQLDTEDIELF